MVNSRALVDRWRKAEGFAHEVVWTHRRKGPPQLRTSLSQDPLVSLVCVSHRPLLLAQVLASMTAQINCRTEFILVTNSSDYWNHTSCKPDELPAMSVIDTHESTTLGQALNSGFEAASGEIICKLDDDDLYSPRYVAEIVATMRKTGAGVVGKKTYLAHLVASDETIVLHDGFENTRVNRVAGGTIAVHSSVSARIGFSHVNLGEDGRYLRAAERTGYAIHGSSRHNYVQVRSQRLGHAWQASDDRLRQAGSVVGPGLEDNYWLSD